jgi:segregation and condensation protein A
VTDEGLRQPAGTGEGRQAEQLALADDWAEPVRGVPDEAILTVQVESWEGPLDLLLALARSQKVDLREISILALVEQYLRFVEEAVELRLELAADYLVMAAWLAYLKSGLLLPKEAQPDPSPEELALRLHLRLQRLEAMREAGARLLARDRVGRDVFMRPAPEGLHRPRAIAWQAGLFDLIAAYGQVKARTAPRFHIVQRRAVMTLDEAIERVSRLIGAQLDWAELRSFLPDHADPQLRRSALASSFVAALELARQGRVEINQEAMFAPLYLRAGSGR